MFAQCRRLGRVIVILTLSALAIACGRTGDAPPAGSLNESGPAAAAVATTNAEIAFWQDRATRDPVDFVSLNQLAAAHLRRARQTGDVSEYQRANAALQAARNAAVAPEYETFALLAMADGARHEFAGALDHARRAVALKPNEPFGYGVLGDALLALGNYPEARAAYEHMVGRAPGLASFSRLALVQTLYGERERAELNWRNAVASDGRTRAEDTAWANTQLGKFYASEGRLDEAVSAYRAALGAFPGYAHALAALAEVHAMRREHTDAIRLYDAASQRMPLPEYVSALGDTYAAAGRAADARREYSLVAAIDQLYQANGVVTDLEMARFMIDHDQAATGLERARAAYAARPSVESADVLAWALYRNDDAAGALAYSDEALRLGTRDATMLFHAGMIRARLADPAAREYLDRALAINPRFSLLHADLAASTLRELTATARRGQ